MAPAAVGSGQLTIDDLCRLPDDGKVRELAAGRVVEWEVPNQLHGALMALLGALLLQVVRPARLGRVVAGDSLVRVRGGEHDARGADVAFFHRDRLTDDWRAPATRAIPDFVIEILSPTDRATEVDAKVRDWLAAGVQLLWYINPDTGTTTVYAGAGGPIQRVEASDLLDAGEVVPGFQVRMRELLNELVEVGTDAS